MSCRPIPYRLAALAVVMTTGYAAAQPPAYGRWSGNTAIAPVQGNFSQGTPLTLTWGFMALNTPINDNNGFPVPNAPNNLPTRLNTIYGSQATWQPLFQSVFDRWSAVSGLSYQFEPNDDAATVTNFSNSPAGQLGVRADVRIGGKALDGNSGTLAYNYFPNHADMVIDTNDTFYNTTTSNSIRLRNVVSHEHGHGMGMPHVQSNNAAFLMEPFINTAFDGPQYHDVLAAHHMYGDVREKSNAGLGNDTFARANPLGTLSLFQGASIGNSARTLAVAAGATDFVSIDSQTDTDFYSFTVNSGGPVSVLLEALGLTYNVTNQAGAGNVAFNTAQRGNLTLALIDTNGTTVLQSVNAGGLGVNESLLFNLPGAGTYFIRVTGVNNPDGIALDTQFYGLTVTPVPEPVGLLLLASAVGAGAWARRVTAGRRRHLARS
jgi:hypothetical protein